MACWEISKFSTSWYYHFGCAYPDMLKVPKIRSLHIFALSAQEMELKWFFCLQINTKVLCKVILFLMCITRLAQSTKNNKFAINIFAISQGKWEEGSWFFACKWTSKISWNWYYHFRCVWLDMPNLLIITTLLFLCNISRKKWEIKLVFCMR